MPASATGLDGTVAFPGALLPALSGEKISRLSAWAAAGAEGPLRPIPFQVDERDPGGRYVLDRPLQGKPEDLPEDDGCLDANDEAVLDASDAGARVPAPAWPAYDRAVEVEVSGGSDAKRYVYLLSGDAPPAPARRDVRYDASGSGRVDTPRYTIGFGENPIIVKSLSIKADGGGDGANLIRGTRSKLYSRLTPYLLSLRIKRDERDVQAVIVGTREGPVRLIRVIKRHTPLLLGLATPETIRTELYTTSAAEWREETGQTLDMKRLVARSVVEERFLLDRAVAGSRFLCEGCPSETIDGRREGPALPLSKARWWGIAGPRGTFTVRYDLEGKAEQEILFHDETQGEAGWQLDINSMNGRIRPLVTRIAFPARDRAADPRWIADPASPSLVVRATASIDRTGPAPLGASGPPAPSTFHRRYDVLVLTGDALRPFLGLPIQSLRLYASRGGRLAAILFQADERDGKGNFVLPEGRAATKDVDDGRLDDNDEIVTMADRVGDRVDGSAWPSGVTRGAEIAVVDPKGGEGWLYLFAFDNPPPEASRRLVRRQAFEEIRSDVFETSFPKGKAYFDRFRMKTSKASAMSDNIVDRLKIRFRLTFSFLYIPLPYRAGEDDFGRETIAWRDGPLRLILRQDLWADLTFGVVFHMEPSDWVFYENQVASEVLVKNPFLYGPGALKRIKGAHFVQSVDLNRAASGMQFYNSVNPDGVVIDGEMSDAEKNLDRRKDQWIVVSGKQANSVARVFFTRGIDPDWSLYYVDDRNRKDWNDRDYGQWGNAGYDVNLKAERSVILLTAPAYRITLYFYLPPDFDISRREEILDILDKPVRVRRRATSG